MKANAPNTKMFTDAVDVLCGIESMSDWDSNAIH